MCCFKKKCNVKIKKYKGFNYFFFLFSSNKNYWKIFVKSKAKILSEVYLCVQGLECVKIKTTTTKKVLNEKI